MSSGTPFTNIGPNLWTWPPFRNLRRHHDDGKGFGAQMLWIGLYTTPSAKSQPPGLFLGSVHTMSEETGIPVDNVRGYLDRLIEDELVEYDIERRVLRLTMLPDAGESPKNGNAIRGWWRRFNNMPACAVRDSHVATLRWILDEFCRVSGKALSADHAKAWSETFGRVAVPSPKPKTRKHVQTSLFSSPDDEQTDREPETLPSSPTSGIPNDHQLRSYNDRITTVIWDQDQDQDQDLQSSEIRAPGITRAQGSDPTSVPSGSGAHVVQSASPPPRVLVVLEGGPHPDEVDRLVDGLHAATRGGFKRTLTTEQRRALSAAISAAGDHTRLADWIALLCEFVRAGLPGVPRDPVSLQDSVNFGPLGIGPHTVAAPGWLSTMLARATERKREIDQQAAIFSAARKQLGFE